MNDPLKTSRQPMLLDLDSDISSAASADGLTRSDSPESPMMPTSGPGPARVSHFRARDPVQEPTMRDTSGQLGFDSFKSADRPSSTVSKSARRRSSVTKEKEAEYQRKYRRTHRAKDLIRHARERSTLRGLPFDLDHHTQEVQARISRGACEVTGLPLNLDGGRTWDSPSLDRIVPAAGYLYENIRIVCHAVNGAMGDWGEQVVIEMALGILGKRKQRSNELSMRLGEALQRNLEGLGSTLFSLTWSQRATPSGSLFWQQRASVRRTSGSDCISWPTPTRATSGNEYTYSRGNHDDKCLTLNGAARLAAQAQGEGARLVDRRERDESVDASATRCGRQGYWLDGTSFYTCGGRVWSTGKLADPCVHKRGSRRGRSEVEGRAEHERSAQQSAGCGDVGAWSDVQWISCSDGKRRPVPTESALFPLAHGVPNRVGLLRGSGNAIVPQVAAAFIRAAQEARRLK